MWLCSSDLKGEMESSIIVAQHKALNTCYHQRNIVTQLTVNAECAIRQNTQNILLQDAQHLHHLNTLIDTIKWLVTSTG